MAQINNDCANAIPLTVNTSCSITDTFTNLDATDDSLLIAPNPTCGAYKGADVWFTFQMPTSGVVRLEINGISVNNQQYALYSGTCGNFTQIRCDQLDEQNTFNDPSYAGQTIYARVFRYNSSNGGTFTFCIWEPEVPTNEDCSNAIPLAVNSSCVITDTFTNQFAGALEITSAPDPTCGAYNGGDVWFSFIMPASGVVRLEINGISNNNQQYAIYSGNCGSLTQIRCDQLDEQNTFNDLTFAGQTLYARVFRYNIEEGGTFTFCLWEPEVPTNEDCTNAIPLAVNSSCLITDTFTNQYAAAPEITAAPNPTCGAYSGGDVWFSFVMPASGIVRLEINGISNNNQQYAIYSGNCGSLTQIRCDQLDEQNTFNDASLAGQTLYARVFRYNTEEGGTFTFCIWEVPAPPNEDCTNAIPLAVNSSCVITDTFTNLYAAAPEITVAPNPTCGAYSGGDVWFSFVMPLSGELRIEIDQISGANNPQYALYGGNCGALTQIRCDQLDAQNTIDDISLAGQTIYIRVFNYNTEEGCNFTLCLWDPPVPINNKCENVIELPVFVECIPDTFSNAYATNDGVNVAPNPTCAAYSGGDVWFKAEMPYTDELSIIINDFTGSPSTDFALYTGTCGNMTQISCGQLNNNQLDVFNQGLIGEDIYIRVFSYNTEEGGDFSICPVGCIVFTDTIITTPACSQNEVGTTIDSLLSVDGCDSLIVTITNPETVNPEAQCQPISVQLNPNGVVNVSANTIDNGSSDNCEIANMVLDNSFFTCEDVGINTVLLTVYDNFSNSDTCSANITVEYYSAPGGSYFDTVNCASTLCPPGTFCPGGTFSATPCSAGSFSANAGASECTLCLAGTSQGEVGQTECVACPVGTFSAVEGAITCAECEAGFFQGNVGQTSCDACPPGKFSNITGAAECQNCTAGTSQGLSGQTECIDCGPGTVSQSAATECTVCPAGTQASADQTVCETCPAGTYSPGNGQPCLPCAAGTVSDAGAAACDLCGPGSEANADQTACDACLPGTYSNPNTNGCTTCPQGTISQSGASQCDFCPAGTQASADQTTCEICPAGTYSPGNGQPCLPCAAGTVSDPGSTVCNQCPAGSEASEDQTECLDCLPGTYSNANSNGCTTCPSGTVSTFSGASECSFCPAGTQASADQTSCESCPPGTFSPGNGQPCLPCAAGTVSGTGAEFCTACSPGESPSNDQSVCEVCPAGTYSVNGTECINCPPGFNSAPGSTECTPIECPLTIIEVTTCDPNQAGIVTDTFLSVTGSCDSIIRTITTLLPSFEVNADTSFCSGDEIIFGQLVIFGAGLFTQTFTAENGCDSIVNLNVSILPSYDIMIEGTTCNENEVGITIDTFVSANGCDSIVTTIVELLPTVFNTITTTSCDPLNVGTTTDTLVGAAANGCDSIVTTITTLSDSYEATIELTTCNENEAGTTIDTLTSATGCDSIITTIVELLPTASATVTATSCDPLNVGITIDTLVGAAANGCDSIVTTITTLLESYNETVEITTCNENEAGTTIDTFSSVNGCDSIVTTIVTLLPTATQTITATSCDPQNVGTSIDTLVGAAANGCDSIVTTITTLLESYSETILETTTNPLEVGTTIDSLTASNGCDSIITTITTLINDCSIELPDTVILACDPISQTAEYCLPISFIDFIDNYELVINDDLYIELPGACDFDTIGGYDFSTAIGATTPTYGGDPHILLEWFINGVDVVNTNFTYSTFEELAAYMQSLNPNGQWAVEDGDRITGGFPNSSANYGALNVFSPQIGALASIVYNSGITSNGTLIQDISTGCQWFYLTNLNEPNCGTDSIYVCVECCEPSNVTVYATSCDPNQVGTSIDSLTNEGGCDSVVTTVTTLLESYTITLTPGVCYESQTEVSIDTLTANNGCDSIIITAPVLLPSYQQEFTETTCDPQLAGIAIDTLKTVDGCDSIITTITTLLESYEVVVNKESCLASDTGSVSEILVASNGCDSIITTITSLVDGYNDTVFLFTCNPMPFDPIVVHFTSSTGCDSTITTIIVLEDDCNIICEDPDNLYATDITFTQATLGWDAVPNGYSYTVQGRLKYNLFGATVTRVVQTNSFRTNHLFPFLTYEFRVQADCLEDEYIEWSHWSDWKAFTLNPFIHRSENTSGRNANELKEIDLFDVEGILTSYPNPSRGDVNIKFNVDESIDANILITDISGREMDRIPIILSAYNKPLISFDDYDNGLYFISFYKDGVKLATEKILLSK